MTCAAPRWQVRARRTSPLALHPTPRTSPLAGSLSGALFCAAALLDRSHPTTQRLANRAFMERCGRPVPPLRGEEPAAARGPPKGAHHLPPAKGSHHLPPAKGSHHLAPAKGSQHLAAPPVASLRSPKGARKRDLEGGAREGAAKRARPMQASAAALPAAVPAARPSVKARGELGRPGSRRAACDSVEDG